MTTLSGVISYPIAVYQNVPIQPGYFQPSQFVISAITLGPTTIISSASNLNYVIGQEIRLLIPPSFGSIQLNGQTGYVISLPSATQIEVNINSINAQAFIASTSKTQSAQIIAIGDINNGILSTTGSNLLNVAVTIPGAFTNISPL